MDDKQIEEILKIVDSCTYISVNGKDVTFREVFELILNYLDLQLVRIPESVKLAKKGDRTSL